jgi:hypothetical protein
VPPAAPQSALGVAQPRPSCFNPSGGQPQRHAQPAQKAAVGTFSADAAIRAAASRMRRPTASSSNRLCIASTSGGGSPAGSGVVAKAGRTVTAPPGRRGRRNGQNLCSPPPSPACSSRQVGCRTDGPSPGGPAASRPAPRCLRQFQPPLAIESTDGPECEEAARPRPCRRGGLDIRHQSGRVGLPVRAVAAEVI